MRAWGSDASTGASAPDARTVGAPATAARASARTAGAGTRARFAAAAASARTGGSGTRARSAAAGRRRRHGHRRGRRRGLRKRTQRRRGGSFILPSIASFLSSQRLTDRESPLWLLRRLIVGPVREPGGRGSSWRRSATSWAEVRPPAALSIHFLTPHWWRSCGTREPCMCVLLSHVRRRLFPRPLDTHPIHAHARPVPAGLQ